MKSLVFAALAVLSVTTFAKEKEQLSKEERKQRMLEKVGGFITVEAKGSIAVVNAQKAFDMNGLTNAINGLSRMLQVPVNRKEGAFDVATARKTLDGLGATAGIFIIDNPAYPMSLSSTEARWGVVNVAALREEGVDDAKLAKRVHKEFNRVSMFVFGGGLSSMKTSVMKPVRSAADLDSSVNVGIPFDTLGVVMNNLSGFGLVRAQRTTYLKACQEGWAPAPTNDIQKAVWDKVHAAPTKPIVIKPETKKQ